jgi:hypothetical protein
MWWMDTLVVPALLILAVYCFAVTVGGRTRMLTRKSTRTAESMYPNYADSIKKQRKYAEEHGTRQDDGSPVPWPTTRRRDAPPTPSPSRDH